MRAIWGVPQRLAVAAHGGDALGTNAAGLPHAMAGGGVDVGQLHIELPQRFQSRFATGQYFQQGSAQRRRVGGVQRTHELEAAFIEIQHHGIDPVEAGAGHKPSEEGAHAALFGDGGVAGFRRGQLGQ